jgi:hypothetical protein
MRISRRCRAGAAQATARRAPEDRYPSGARRQTPGCSAANRRAWSLRRGRGGAARSSRTTIPACITRLSDALRCPSAKSHPLLPDVESAAALGRPAKRASDWGQDRVRHATASFGRFFDADQCSVTIRIEFKRNGLQGRRRWTAGFWRALTSRTIKWGCDWSGSLPSGGGCSD